MKLQRSRFRIVSLVLFVVFVLVALLCAGRVGLIQPVMPEETKAEDPVPSAEPLALPDVSPGDGSTEASPPPDSEFDIYGL